MEPRIIYVVGTWGDVYFIVDRVFLDKEKAIEYQNKMNDKTKSKVWKIMIAPDAGHFDDWEEIK